MHAKRLHPVLLSCLLLVPVSSAMGVPRGQGGPALVPKFNLSGSGLEIERQTRPGSFFDVLGRRSAVFGYENRTLEAWVYPLKILDDFKLSFSIQGYPLEIHGPDTAVTISVRPEATVITYSHAAFTVRQIILAPIDEPGILMLLDIQAVLPLTVTGSFRPKLRLMWPAGLMTSYLRWDDEEHTYTLSEETRRFVGIVGSPFARDLSVMPYQEEPRDTPIRFAVAAPPESVSSHFLPIVIAGSVDGREKARTAYNRLLNSAHSLYERNVAHYSRLRETTLSIVTPDERINKAFEWAKVGIDKGIVENPQLGTGLVAGFRTSGESERPGFAWFFGRDALWSALAITSYGDFAAVRTALDFLTKFQREDGKIPHEISQSAALIPWFSDYPYPWASADSTPLYIIAHADYWRASGDTDYIKKNWDSIVRAHRFVSSTDTDGNALIENTGVGHGWVEGGALYPAHEEIYMQGLWVEALRGFAELAEATGNNKLAADARAAADRVRDAIERTYWLADRGFYAFATHSIRNNPRIAEPGPNRERRQERLRQLDGARLIDEDTVLPAVPLWWGMLDPTRAQSEIDHLAGGSIATDWGNRILSGRSRLYDPLSYHYGSVWPLFTGWAAMGAYRYGRPSAGFQAMMANVLLTYEGALGYVTELLSGDFNASFGRSSHHQVWSEAMVVTPIVRGLFGIEAGSGGKSLTVSPQLPANWDHAEIRNVAVSDGRYDVVLDRTSGRRTVRIVRRGGAGVAARLIVASAFPHDARIKAVTVNGVAGKFKAVPLGDVQRVEVLVADPALVTEVAYVCDEGTEVFAEPHVPSPGATNRGLRILQSRPEAGVLRLVLEGVGGITYRLQVRTPRRLGEASGVRVVETSNGLKELLVAFEGPPDTYVRREILVPLVTRK